MIQKRIQQSQDLQFKNDFLIKFPQKHLNSAPKFEKITIQSNKLKENKGPLHPMYTELTNLLRRISGQTGKLIFSQESVASFDVMKGDILGVKLTLRKLNLISFLEKLIFIVHVGEDATIWPEGKGLFHPHGHIQWGSPLYFIGIKFDIKEKFGWNISLSITSSDSKNVLAKQYLASHNLILFRIK